jgi:1-acyl-sn-glycerol-3-phosphate acyltransferase
VISGQTPRIQSADSYQACSEPAPVTSVAKRLRRGLALVLHLVQAAAVAPLFSRWSTQRQDRYLQTWAQGVLRILGVQVVRSGSVPSPTGLMVCNHVSWLDIFVIQAALPGVRFVAKSDVRQWPLIGWLAARAGTVFLQRERPRDAVRVNADIANRLRHNQPTVVFAQGTSTHAHQPLQFFAALFQSAIDADTAVQPLALGFTGPHGQHLDAVTYTLEVSLAQSLRQVLAEPVIQAHVAWLPSLPVQGQNRRELAAQAQSVIGGHLARFTPAPATTGTSHSGTVDGPRGDVT